MRRYDLQVHTDASPCSNTSPEAVVDAAVDERLDGIAITDHDTMDSVARTSKLAPEGLDVIPGVEVTTTQGHVLGLYVERPPPQADPLTVIDDIHRQGGFAVLSHPFDRLRQTFTEHLPEILARADGVETVNSRVLVPSFNRRAREISRKCGLPATGGSDAHFPAEVGRAYTVTDTGLDEALRTGRTEAVGRGGYLSGHVRTKLLDLRALLGDVRPPAGR
jgi:predicted metal-dependent phosphoesterase TrpH